MRFFWSSFGVAFLAVELVLGGTAVFGADFQPHFQSELLKNFLADASLKADLRPTWSNWDFTPFLLKIDRSVLGQHNYYFGVICTGGSHCKESVGEILPEQVKFVVKDDNLLLLPADDSNDPLHSAPIARWKIAKANEDYLFLNPDLNQSVSYVQSAGSMEKGSDFSIFDRFFHDFRTGPNGGFWFHETLRYEYKTYDLLGLLLGKIKNTNPEIKVGATTFTIYLIPTPFSEEFQEKKPIRELGFFVNEENMGKAMIYDGGEVFNPNGYKIIKWASGRSVQWIVHGAPEEIYPYVEQGIVAWNKYLSGVFFEVRPAEDGEELDSPYKNVLFYEASDSSNVGGIATFSFHPKSGEIFRSVIRVSGPSSLKISKEKDPAKNQLKGEDFGSLFYGSKKFIQVKESFGSVKISGKSPEELAKAISGVVAHEIGHALGLRHNFKGSRFTGNLEDYPAGSSVMEYPDDFSKLRIGPYDIQAIKWAYGNEEPSFEYPFCTDEMAGFMIFLAPKDPECHRLDPPVDDHFEYYYKKVHALVSEHVPTATPDGENGFGFDNLMFLFPYLGVNDAQNRSEKIWGLLDVVSGYPLEDSEVKKTLYLSTVEAFFNWGLGTLLRSDLITHRKLYESKGRILPLLEWVANVVGDSAEGLKVRRSLVEEVLGWRDNPFGMFFADYLKTELKAAQSSSSNHLLRLENTFLLTLWEEKSQDSEKTISPF